MSKGISTGVPDDTSTDYIIPEGATGWEVKLGEWMRFRKSCQLKAGPIGTYCRWAGASCCYQGCPARVFEEVKIGLYPEDAIPESVKIRVRRVDEEVKALTKHVTNLTQTQNKGFKNIKDELNAIKERIEKE